MLTVGIDWARCNHQVALMNEAGELIDNVRIAHSAAGFCQLADLIAEHAQPANVQVAVEHHEGFLLQALVAAGYRVYAINPKSADRARDRYRPGGGKDDRTDAFVLADTLRLDAARLTPYRAHREETDTVRMLHAERFHLMQDRTRVAQQLRALLQEYAPTLNALTHDLNRLWQRDLLALCPTDGALAKLHGNRLHAFCKHHRLPQKTRDALAAARRAPMLNLPAHRDTLLSGQIKRLLERYVLLTDQLAQLEADLDAAISQHPSAPIIQSLPVKGTATVAGLLALFGDRQADSPSWRPIASSIGVSPVTIASGRSRVVKRRRACSKRYHQTLLDLAFNTAFRDGCWAKDYYRAKRDQGVDHFTALRSLAQRWIKVLHAMWKHHAHYHETHHQLKRQAAAA